MMALLTACVEPADDGGDDVPTEAAALTGYCTVLRPVGWNVAGRTCVETPSTPIMIPVGDDYVAYSSGGGIYGEGYTVLHCEGTDYLTTTARVCNRSRGVPQ